MLVPDGIYITATVDVDDIEEVLDLYIHRLTQLPVAEGLPFYGSVVQTPERLARLLAEHQAGRGGTLVGRSLGSSDSTRDRRPGSVLAAQYEP